MSTNQGPGHSRDLSHSFCSGVVILAHVSPTHPAQRGPSLPATLAQLQGTEHTEAGPRRSPHSTGRVMWLLRELGGMSEGHWQIEL